MVPFQIYSLKNIYNAPKHKTLYLLFDLFEITCVFREKKKSCFQLSHDKVHVLFRSNRGKINHLYLSGF